MSAYGFFIVLLDIVTLLPFLGLSFVIGWQISDVKFLADAIFSTLYLATFAVATFVSSVLLIVMVMCSYRISSKKKLIKIAIILMISAMALDTVLVVTVFRESIFRNDRFVSRMEDTALESMKRYKFSDADKNFWDKVHGQSFCCGLGNDDQLEGGTPQSCFYGRTVNGKEVTIARKTSCLGHIVWKVRLNLLWSGLLAVALCFSHFASALVLFFWHRAHNKSVSNGLQQVAEVISPTTADRDELYREIYAEAGLN